MSELIFVLDEISSEDETQPTNINESFDVALEELWPLVIKNGMDKTRLPAISEGFSYVRYKFSSFLILYAILLLNRTVRVNCDF